MKNFNLNELLRYGISGGYMMVVFALGFTSTLDLVFQKNNSIIGGPMLIFLSLILGSIGYTLYRAILLPVISLVAKKFAEIEEPDIDLIISAWKNSKKKNALQPILSEWAAHIHLLYTCAIFGDFLLLSGFFFGLEISALFAPLFALNILMIGAVFIYHMRYLLYDKRVRDHDNKLKVYL